MSQRLALQEKVGNQAVRRADADRAKVSVRAVKRFEHDEETTPVVASAIRRALKQAGLRVLSDVWEFAKTEGDIVAAFVLAPQ